VEFKIQNKKVGKGHPLFFIAEAGVNHNGSKDLGKKLIDIATDAGADAVKFQTFKTENIITSDAPKSTYHVETTGEDQKQSWFELLKTQEMSRSMHVALIEHCNENGIIFLSTPYDEDSADLLEELNVPAFKIASTDTNNLPFLSYVAAKGRPMILSSAMATMEEVKDAVAVLRDQKLEDFAVLQCTGNYPSKLSDSHLSVMKTYANQLKCIIGYSDHTPDLINPVAATAMGAKVYEKHFTIDKTLAGPDHRMSLDGKELRKTIKAIRNTEKALGNPEKNVLEIEKENRTKLRKSIVANKDIFKGEIMSNEMLAIKRPGNGMPPGKLESVIGSKAKIDINYGTVITLEMFDAK
tara:strand:- start:47130 stop:48188 length:1059 start_codon:yes stop_codon:yes gene_type:complete